MKEFSATQLSPTDLNHMTRMQNTFINNWIFTFLINDLYRLCCLCVSITLKELLVDSICYEYQRLKNGFTRSEHLLFVNYICLFYRLNERDPLFEIRKYNSIFQIWSKVFKHLRVSDSTLLPSTILFVSIKLLSGKVCWETWQMSVLNLERNLTLNSQRKVWSKQLLVVWWLIKDTLFDSDVTPTHPKPKCTRKCYIG